MERTFVCQYLRHPLFTNSCSAIGSRKYSGRQRNKVEDKKIDWKTASSYALLFIIQWNSVIFRSKSAQAGVASWPLDAPAYRSSRLCCPTRRFIRGWRYSIRCPAMPQSMKLACNSSALPRQDSIFTFQAISTHFVPALNWRWERRKSLFWTQLLVRE